jgi:hypothetical protein
LHQLFDVGKLADQVVRGRVAVAFIIGEVGVAMGGIGKVETDRQQVGLGGFDQLNQDAGKSVDGGGG